MLRTIRITAEDAEDFAEDRRGNRIANGVSTIRVSGWVKGETQKVNDSLGATC
jgi:hypothetical protein